MGIVFEITNIRELQIRAVVHAYNDGYMTTYLFDNIIEVTKKCTERIL